MPLIVLAGVVALLSLQTDPERQRQDEFVFTVAIAFACGVALLVWLVLFSRLSTRVRYGVLGVVVGAAVVLGLTVEKRGHSGDLVPQFGWRFRAPATPAAPPPQQAPEQTPHPAAPPAVDPARDFPQFLGPGGDGEIRGLRLATDWDANPPRELWRITVGPAWSGFAVAGPVAVTLEQRDDEEWVVAYERTTGATVWTHREAARWADPLGGPGPRSTPSIADGTVYAMGATGLLVALDLADGSVRWRRDVMTDAGAQPPEYGVAASPLVHEDVVVVMAGGPGHSVVAYDRADGTVRWAAGDDPAGYSSPRLATLAGVEQILQLTGRRLVAYAPTDGAPLWSTPWPSGTQNTSQPVVLPGDRVYLSSGYGVGGVMYRVAQQDGALAAEVLWRARSLKAKFTDVVTHDGFLYGLDDGILVCVDGEDGSRRWKQGRYGHGQVLLVDDLLLVMAESGDVALVAADPAGFRELASFPALTGRTWNHPALAGSHLIVRNDHEAAAFELPLASPVARANTRWYREAR